MKYKVEKVVVCEVRVWAVIEADSMDEAMGQAAGAGTDNGHYDHEIISDIKTIVVKIKEAE